MRKKRKGKIPRPQQTTQGKERTEGKYSNQNFVSKTQIKEGKKNEFRE